MRLPEPAALLVEHPAVPVPDIEDDGIALPKGAPPGDRVVGTVDRYRLAVQLTATAALLADFDLWIERRSFRNAATAWSDDGPGVCLSGLPVPLSRVAARLGGGQVAAEAMRRSVIESIAEAVDLPVSKIDVERGEPGLFLTGALARQLAELPQPLRRCTARRLWMLRWDPLPPPEPGAASYWSVPRQKLAIRLAASQWASLRRRGREVWLRKAGGGDCEGTISRAVSGNAVLIVVGDIGTGELEAISSWTRGAERSAVAVGSFPAGWHPPRAPGCDAARLSRHLALAAPEPETARRLIDHRSGRFDPFDTADRRALTDAARNLFQEVPSIDLTVRDRSPSDSLESVLSLDPDGVPREFVNAHCRLVEDAMEVAAGRLSVISDRGKWRLPQVRPLQRDPLHAEVAAHYPTDDPRHLLHEMLGTGDGERLESWVRERLHDLDGTVVRDLLATVAPSALGPRLAALAVEACLSILDLSGARIAMAGIGDDDRPALSGWLNSIDHDGSGTRVDDSTLSSVREARVAAEIAVRELSRLHRRGLVAGADALRSHLNRSMAVLSDPVRRFLEIDLAAIDMPGRFEDRGWRREIADGHPALVGRLMYRRALRLVDVDRPRDAIRLLRRLQDESLGPGRSGVIENDLGAASVVAGWSRRAEIHQLRAFRLLQAAGFRHATRFVLFNLAVADIDQLRVRQAADRLKLLGDEEIDRPYVAGESSRLALAVGDETRFRAQLGEFEGLVDAGKPPFREGLALLRGVAAVFDGRLNDARELFEAGGQEGRTWLSVVDAMEGRPLNDLEHDAWGVTLAARCLAESSAGPADRDDADSPSASLAVALALRLHGGLAVEPHLRLRARERLRAAGLEGWAEQLREQGEASIVAALARVVEFQGWAGLDPSLAERLLASLGVTGLEVRAARSGNIVWCHGDGEPGTEVRSGRLLVVPLGGEVSDDPGWSLVKALLELYLPSSPGSGRDEDPDDIGFVGSSEAARILRRDIRSLAPSHLPIVILGETGVGKEVAARAIHRLSGRRGSFVAVNVNAIPTNLLESELFGSVRGAFTGAERSRQGLIMAAHHGTLFLDEIGDLDPPLQVKLLRFLEGQEIRPVGSDRAQVVDVRILSATHRDLEARVRDGRFRHDLYYRLAMCPLVIPPLRERREDIEDLAEHFQREAVDRYGLQPVFWSSQASSALRGYHWPGNARELQKAVEVAMVRAAGGVVRGEHLPIGGEFDDLPAKTWDEAQRQFRASYLTAALRRNRGNRSATARELGISRQALLYHLRRLGLTDSEKT